MSYQPYAAILNSQIDHETIPFIHNNFFISSKHKLLSKVRDEKVYLQSISNPPILELTRDILPSQKPFAQCFPCCSNSLYRYPYLSFDFTL